MTKLIRKDTDTDWHPVLQLLNQCRVEHTHTHTHTHGSISRCCSVFTFSPNMLICDKHTPAQNSLCTLDCHWLSSADAIAQLAICLSTPTYPHTHTHRDMHANTHTNKHWELLLFQCILSQQTKERENVEQSLTSCKLLLLRWKHIFLHSMSRCKQRACKSMSHWENQTCKHGIFLSGKWKLHNKRKRHKPHVALSAKPTHCGFLSFCFWTQWHYNAIRSHLGQVQVRHDMILKRKWTACAGTEFFFHFKALCYSGFISSFPRPR